ncbi:MAG: hypothetical protein ACRDPE_03710 [Solirubrobacterales bacterium]
MKDPFENFPWLDLLGVLAAVVGGVIVIVEPTTLSYPHYLSGLGFLLGGAGAMGIASNAAGKTETGVIALLDVLPWAKIIGAIAILAGAVVVIVEPSTLDFQEWLKQGGILLVGTGVFGFSRSQAGKGVAAKAAKGVHRRS